MRRASRAILADAGDAERCPSKWGAKDQLGSGNLMKPEMALRAAKLVRTGEVFQLGFDLSANLPLIGSRRFDLHMKRGTATAPGTRGENEEIVITELGQWARSWMALPTRCTAANTTTALRTKK